MVNKVTQLNIRSSYPTSHQYAMIREKKITPKWSPEVQDRKQCDPTIEKCIILKCSFPLGVGMSTRFVLRTSTVNVTLLLLGQKVSSSCAALCSLHWEKQQTFMSFSMWWGVRPQISFSKPHISGHTL